MNVQCHYSTEVDFGPQVNFLVGVNGSGKSAVLTGITMALGGNAKATVRLSFAFFVLFLWTDESERLPDG